MTFDTKEIFTGAFLILGFFYPLWPVMVLTPLRVNRRNQLPFLILAWGFSLITWLSYISAPTPHKFALIPEPFNTILFFLTGVSLVIVIVVKRFR